MQTLGHKKAMAAGILAVIMSVTAILMVQSASAQTSNQTSTKIPDIRGSVSIDNATNQFLKENVKVPFNTAAQTAVGEVDGGVVLSGKLTAVQGYLSYVFKVADFDAGTLKIVIVDAGNGSVLYTSDNLALRNGVLGGEGCWRHDGFGHGHWMGKNMTNQSSQNADVETTSA